MFFKLDTEATAYAVIELVSPAKINNLNFDAYKLKIHRKYLGCINNCDDRGKDKKNRMK